MACPNGRATAKTLAPRQKSSPRHHAQAPVGIAVTCHCLNRRVRRFDGRPGGTFLAYVMLYAMWRVVIDPLRIDGRPGHFAGMSFEQWTALAVGLAAGAALTWRLTRSAGRNRPAVMAGG